MGHSNVITVSGQVEKQVYDQLSESAKKSGISLSRYIAYQLESMQTASDKGPIRRIGNEKGCWLVRLPKTLAQQVNIAEGEYVRIRQVGNGLYIERI